jgi:hypothetical protein
MTLDDYAEFQKCMAIISETYSKPTSSAKLDIWWSIFASYDVSDFEQGIFKHVTDPSKGTFEPKPADILRYMPKPEKPTLVIENKGSTVGCQNCKTLVDKYHPVTGSYFKTIITNADNLKVENNGD